MRRLAGNAQGLQTFRAITFRDGIRHIGDRLGRLPDRDGGDDLLVSVSMAASASAFSSPT
jgi:hypothetical protein